MATKPTRNKPKQDGWQPKGFVNLSLTEAQVQTALKLYGEEEKLSRDYLAILYDGYRVTTSYDPRSEAFVCTLNCKDEASENYGWLLSSFAPTPHEALVLTLYKHVYILEGSWAEIGNKAPAARYG